MGAGWETRCVLGRRDTTRQRGVQRTVLRPATVRSSRYLGLDIAFQDTGDFGRVASQVHTVDVAWPRQRNCEFLANASRVWGEQNDAVTQADGFTHVVSDEDDGLTMLAPDSLDVTVQLFACQGVERAEGFIHQEDAGVWRQGPSQGHALFHAAGQFMDIGMHELLEADEFKKILGLLTAFRRAQPINEFEAEEDVSEDRQPWKQRRFLKHDEAVRARPGNGLTVSMNHTAIGPFQAGDDIKQRGFSAPTRTDETDELSFGNVEGDIIKRVDVQRTGSKPFRDLFENELRGNGLSRIDFSRGHLSSAFR